MKNFFIGRKWSNNCFIYFLLIFYKLPLYRSERGFFIYGRSLRILNAIDGDAWLLKLAEALIEFERLT
jgi:hypothetical protein